MTEQNPQVTERCGGFADGMTFSTYYSRNRY